ncbi:MAG: ABC transporter permease [Clostridiales bacterium]|nr:ABC transporter permease [Clostridiales bacterium]
MADLRILFASVRVQMVQTFARPMFKFCMLVSPLLFALLWGEMYRNANDADFFAYVCLGSGLFNLWGCICFSSAGDINRERWSNTLRLLFAVPADFRLTLLGKILGNTLLSVGSFFISVAFAALVYQRPIIVRDPGLFALAFFLMLICFVVFSLFFAYMLTLSRKTQLWMNCIDLPLTLLCGFAFPVELLPVWVRLVSYAFPPTWAVKLLRTAATGGDGTFTYWQSALWLGVTTLAFALVTALAYRAIYRQIKKSGSLELA